MSKLNQSIVIDAVHEFPGVRELRLAQDGGTLYQENEG